MQLTPMLAAIRDALCKYQGLTVDEVSFDPDNVRVIENYVPDSPGWIGNLAWVVHGEASYHTLLKQTYQRGDWEVLFQLDDTCFGDPGRKIAADGRAFRRIIESIEAAVPVLSHIALIAEQALTKEQAS